MKTATTSSVAAALKAAKAQSEAANPSADGTTPPAAPAAPTKKTRTPKPPKVKPAKDPKIKVDDAWMTVLTDKVNEKFVDILITNNPAVAEHGKAVVNFAVAKNKGIPVSLTPRIIYANGAVQSPGPKGRLGFCTDQKFDEWFVKVEEKLNSAMEKKPRLKGKPATKGTFWSEIADKLRVTLGDTYCLKTTGARLTVHQAPPVVDGAAQIPAVDWPLIAAFKQEGDVIVLSSSKGAISEIHDLMSKVIEAADSSK